MRRHLPVLSPLSISALGAAVRSLTTASDRRTELARLLCAEYSATGALLTATGTAALELAIRSVLDAPGSAGAVALPAYTCYDVATAAVGAQAGIVLYDVDPDTLAPDPDSFTDALRTGARAAVVAPLYGVPVDWQALESIASAHDATLIEDAAQGHGASWRDRPLGACGRLSVLSFGRGKGWTGGAGGALLWREHGAPDKDGSHATADAGARTSPIVDSAALLAPANGGAAAIVAAAAQWLFGRPSLYGLPAAVPWLRLGETVYREPPPKRTMPPTAAALILATRAAARLEAAARRTRADALRDRLGALAFVRPREGAVPGWLRLPLRLAPPAAAAAALQLRHFGIGPAYPTTLAELPAVRQALLPGSERHFPGATTLVNELVTVPTHSLLRDDEYDALIAALTAASARHFAS